MFSHVVRPPSRRGSTWSKVRCCGLPQYWQAKRSRRNTLKRVNAGNSLGRTYWRSAITEGIYMSSDGECTSRS